MDGPIKTSGNRTDSTNAVVATLTCVFEFDAPSPGRRTARPGWRNVGDGGPKGHRTRTVKSSKVLRGNEPGGAHNL